MSKIGQHYVELTELGRLERDEYAPEAELPENYQKSIDRDYADDWWKHENNKFKDTDNPVF